MEENLPKKKKYSGFFLDTEKICLFRKKTENYYENKNSSSEILKKHSKDSCLWKVSGKNNIFLGKKLFLSCLKKKPNEEFQKNNSVVHSGLNGAFQSRDSILNHSGKLAIAQL